jgi:hypothetical protein
MGSVRCVDMEKTEFAIFYDTEYSKLCKALAKVIRQSNTWAEGLRITHEKDNNILLKGIMTTAKLCCLCKNRHMLTILWNWWWKEWDNGHDNIKNGVPMCLWSETKLMIFTFISFLEWQTVKGSCKGQYEDKERDTTVKESLESNDSCHVEAIARLVHTS